MGPGPRRSSARPLRPAAPAQRHLLARPQPRHTRRHRAGAPGLGRGPPGVRVPARDVLLRPRGVRRLRPRRAPRAPGRRAERGRRVVHPRRHPRARDAGAPARRLRVARPAAGRLGRPQPDARAHVVAPRDVRAGARPDRRGARPLRRTVPGEPDRLLPRPPELGVDAVAPRMPRRGRGRSLGGAGGGVRGQDRRPRARVHRAPPRDGARPGRALRGRRTGARIAGAVRARTLDLGRGHRPAPDDPRLPGRSPPTAAETTTRQPSSSFRSATTTPSWARATPSATCSPSF